MKTLFTIKAAVRSRSRWRKETFLEWPLLRPNFALRAVIEALSVGRKTSTRGFGPASVLSKTQKSRMPHHHDTTVSGTITHIFGHRFVIKTEQGDMLADITPKGLEQIALRLNDTVTVEGEMKPSELKVSVNLSKSLAEEENADQLLNQVALPLMSVAKMPASVE
jgi:hypothetical protein